MDFKQQFLTKNLCYQEGRPLTPRGVMVHSTGVAQPDPMVFVRRWNRPDITKCVHAFVAQDQIVQTLPWTTRGWHAGTGTSGRSANDTHLSFECCEPAGHTYQGGTMVGYDVEANRPYFLRIYQNAVELTARLCAQFSLNPLEPGVVICHAEGHDLGIASGHGDVLQWWPKHEVTMDQFRRDVAAAMDHEEDDMTQERFDEMMNDYLARRAQLPPGNWSASARDWAEKQGLVAGDGSGDLRYQALATREETVQMLYRLAQTK
ncbi:MAG: N-acetylmuramoyl-L-alanine amidase [Lawsonibacter sp.]|nr:N-acetylmuramoyl-L-alanine amidase [Lawsonibacter sp.]